LQEGLNQVASCLAEAVENLAQREQEAARTMADQTRPGPWQSVLPPTLAERIYDHNLGGLENHVRAAVESLGEPENWVACPVDVLTSRILDYARDYFRGTGSLLTADLLAQPSSFSDISHWLSDLLHRAAPQCAFSPVTQSRVPSQTAHVLILEGADDSAVTQSFRALSPEAKVLTTGNNQMVVVVSMRWGLPVFALPRMNAYWTAYADALLKDDRPIHASLEDLFLPEPIPPQVGLPDRSVLFAVALGLGLIRRDSAGLFLVKNASERPISLGHRKEPAALLLGQWPKGARALYRTIRATVSTLGHDAVADQLQSYLQVTADLAPWERQAIEVFAKRLNQSK